MFFSSVVVAKNRSAPHVRTLTDIRISDVTQMRALDSVAKPRRFHFNEIAHSAPVVYDGVPKPSKRTYRRARVHVRAYDMRATYVRSVHDAVADIRSKNRAVGKNCAFTFYGAKRLYRHASLHTDRIVDKRRGFVDDIHTVLQKSVEDFVF